MKRMPLARKLPPLQRETIRALAPSDLRPARGGDSGPPASDLGGITVGMASLRPNCPGDGPPDDEFFEA